MPTAARHIRAPTVQERRGTAHQRGYGKKDWGVLRAAHISEFPLCAHCLKRGQVVRATEVDHIIPFNGQDDPLRLDPSNLQSLCRMHHARKTATDCARARLACQSGGGGSNRWRACP